MEEYLRKISLGGEQFCEKRIALLPANKAIVLNLWQKIGLEIIGEIPDAFNHATNGLTNAYIMYRKL